MDIYLWRIIPACAGKILLDLRVYYEKAQILETSGCGFAVFSGVADKNASEPKAACALAQSIASPSKNWFSTSSQNPQAPLWLVKLWYIVLAAPTFAI